VWFTEEAVAAWHAPANRERGGQPIYSAIAIETGLALRLVFHHPLRQTKGLLRSIADVLGVDIAIPDHTTLSRRGGGLTILLKRLDRAEPLHLVVDTTGLKIYGEGDWLDQKHGIRSRRRWRKLHLGIDAVTREIVASELTPDDVDDVSEMPALLHQIDAEVASMNADGAYDGEAVHDAVAKRHPEAAVIIRSRVTAVPNESTTTQRDRHIAETEKHGRMNWQRRSGYNRRSLVETAMYRYKTVVLNCEYVVRCRSAPNCDPAKIGTTRLMLPCKSTRGWVPDRRRSRPRQSGQFPRDFNGCVRINGGVPVGCCFTIRA
jgi:hypothetical protein